MRASMTKEKKLQIGAFISVEQAARLELPATASVRFAGAASKLSRPVQGRLVQSSLASPSPGFDQEGVRVEIEISLKDLTVLTADIKPDDWPESVHSICVDDSAHVILSRLNMLPECAEQPAPTPRILLGGDKTRN